MHELERYGKKVAAHQETTWLESAVHHVGGSAVLAAGHRMPVSGEHTHQGQGAAIGPAITTQENSRREMESMESKIGVCISADGQ